MKHIRDGSIVHGLITTMLDEAMAQAVCKHVERQSPFQLMSVPAAFAC